LPTVALAIALLTPQLALSQAKDEPTESGARLVLIPTADRLRMGVVDPDELLLTDAPMNCRYTVAQGSETVDYRVSFESGWDAFDLGSICLVDLSSAAPRASWPPSTDLTISVEVVVAEQSVLSDSETVAVGTPMSSRRAMVSAINAAGFITEMGEASQSLGAHHTFELTATRDATTTQILVTEGALAEPGRNDCRCPDPLAYPVFACNVCGINHRVRIESTDVLHTDELGRVIAEAIQ